MNIGVRKHTAKTNFDCTRELLHWPLRKIARLGQGFLSKTLLLTCEVAMEYMLSLTYSPQVSAARRHTCSLQWHCQLMVSCKPGYAGGSNEAVGCAQGWL